MRRNLLASVIVSFLLLSPPGARAQEVQTEGGTKHLAPAIGLAVANTAIPLAVSLASGNGVHEFLLFYSCVVGPFPGLAFAGDTERGMEGVGIRLLTAGLAVGILYLDAIYDHESEGESDDLRNGLLVVPAGITLASWIYDIAAIPPAVRRRNESVAVSPLVGPRGQVGVQVQVRW